MYERFYQFRERPFALSPDPDYLYLGSVHRTGLDYLRYGLEGHAGFVVITGEIGSGKTTLLQALLRTLDAETTIARLVNTILDPRELLEAVMLDVGIAATGMSKPAMLRELARLLVLQRSQGRRVLLVIDEAQNLSLPGLEEVRMLSNFETEKSKLIQIVLVGQPELRDTLALPQLEQLRQRVGVTYHLSPLDADATEAYINHRLRRAALGAPLRFGRDVTDLVYAGSGGVPRLINVICDSALLFGYGEERRIIDAPLLKSALDELETTGVLRRSPAQANPILAHANPVEESSHPARPDRRLVEHTAVSGWLEASAGLENAGPIRTEPAPAPGVEPPAVSGWLGAPANLENAGPIQPQPAPAPGVEPPAASGWLGGSSNLENAGSIRPQPAPASGVEPPAVSGWLGASANLENAGPIRPQPAPAPGVEPPAVSGWLGASANLENAGPIRPQPAPAPGVEPPAVSGWLGASANLENPGPIRTQPAPAPSVQPTLTRPVGPKAPVRAQSSVGSATRASSKIPSPSRRRALLHAYATAALLALGVLVLTSSGKPPKETIDRTGGLPAGDSASQSTVSSADGIEDLAAAGWQDLLAANESLDAPAAESSANILRHPGTAPAPAALQQPRGNLAAQSANAIVRPREYVGTLAVESAPPGATVFINRRAVGTTPLKVPRLKAGSYAVWVERDGYQRWTASVLVPANRQTRLDVELLDAER